MKSGKLALRLPKTIHAQAAQCAEVEGISFNQWLVSVVSMAVARSQCGQKSIPQDRLEAIAADAFCDGSETCGSDKPIVGLCAACDAIYAAREALQAREASQKEGSL